MGHTDCAKVWSRGRGERKGAGVRQGEREGERELVGVLSPVNHKGLHQGWREREGGELKISKYV